MFWGIVLPKRERLAAGTKENTFDGDPPKALSENLDPLDSVVRRFQGRNPAPIYGDGGHVPLNADLGQVPTARRLP
jgi:hypothetical protein